MAKRFVRAERHVILAERLHAVMRSIGDAGGAGGGVPGRTVKADVVALFERANTMNDSDAADIIVFKAARNQPYELYALSVEEVENAWRGRMFRRLSHWA